MAKNREDVALEQLKGFYRRGASTRSPGNIPTGHFELDFIIHYGVNPKKVDFGTLKKPYNPSKPLGLPLGKLVELYGEEGAGKSSIAYRVCGMAQKMGYDCVWIDAEHSFSDDLAFINGVDRDDLIFSDLINDQDPDVIYHAEDIFDNIIAACKMNAKKRKRPIGVIVLDSVANLIPKARMEATADQAQVGVVARLMSENLKKIVNYAAKYGVLVIFINQLRDKIGVMWGNPETTPGGKALRYNASVRIRVGKKTGKDADINSKDEEGREILVGRKALIRFDKNRMGKPYRGDASEGNSVLVPIFYEQQFEDLDTMIFNVGRQLKIIMPYKDEFRWSEKKMAVAGKDEFMEAVKMKGLMNDLLTSILRNSKEKKVLLPPELVQTIETKLGEDANVKVDAPPETVDLPEEEIDDVPDVDMGPEDAEDNKSFEDEEVSNEVEPEALVEAEAEDGNAEVAKSARRKRKA